MASSLEPNVARLLWRAAGRWGNATAAVERGHEISYAGLQARAAAIASALRSAGLQIGERVAVWLDGGVETIAAFFGIVAAGGIAVLLNDALQDGQTAHIMENCGAAALITAAGLRSAQAPIAAPGCRVLDLDDVPAAGSAEPIDQPGEHPAQIIYTSGSTGRPKGVTITHTNLWVCAQVVTGYLGIVATDRIAGFLPLSFVYGMNQVLCAVSTGATLVISRAPLAADLARELQTQRVTVLAAVPTLWMQLLDSPGFREEPLPHLRVMTNAGGALPVTRVRAMRAAQPQAQLFLMYGLTEALRCTYLPPEEVDRHPNSIGHAIAGADVLVLRDDLTPCAPGEVGELVYRGPTVALGYWNDPEGTARVFRLDPRITGARSDRVVFTGDLVQQDEAGFLYFVGRRDRMIKTLGYRVSPDEVSEVIYASGEVADCVVGAEVDEVRGQRIVAHVVLAAGGSLERLEHHCRVELPRYLRGLRLDLRDKLPRLPNGKPDLTSVGGGAAP